MQKLLKEYLDDLNKRQKRKRKAMIAAMLLVVLVVGSVLGGLTQYGVAMTGREKCGMEEHKHGEACCTKTLTCGKEETKAHAHTEECLPGEDTKETAKAEQEEQKTKGQGHTHTDDCYGKPELVCEKETEGHSHTDDCYSESEPEKVLDCELEETEGHSHTDDCYSRSEPELTCGEEGEDHSHSDDCYSKSEPELTCGEEETEGHSHGDGCYRESEPERELTCKEEETKGHTHTDDCYKAELICGREEETEVHTDADTDAGEDAPAAEGWACGLEEGEAHTHTEDCYSEELTCEKEEHVHTEACYIDKEADVESQEQWDQQYADTEWQELWGEDLVTAARVQLGYTESTDNYEIGEDGNHKGYTRYGHFADADDWYMDWDAAFVNYCLHYAGPAASGFFPDETDTAEWMDAFCEIREENQQYLTSPEDGVPNPGDLIWLQKEEQETEKQMGIVSAYDEDTDKIQVIQGNSENEVRENTYDAADEDIIGYLKLSELEKAYKNLTEGTGLTEEEQAQVDAVIALIEALPDLQEVEARFKALQEAEDEEGYDAYYQELYAQVLEAKNAYDALSEVQKLAVTNAEKLLQYEWLWTDIMDGQNAVWDVMRPDEAYVNEISVSGIATGAAPFDTVGGDGNDTTADDLIVRTFDTVTYHFNINMKSWDSSKSYRQARVKLEFALPLTESEAVFDQTAMAWMDQTEGYQPKLTTETRTIDGEETTCQVLTCYKLLLPSSGNQSVVPGDFRENVTVNVRSMKNGQKFAPILSAAMEGGTWEGTCAKEDHKIDGKPATEKKTVTAERVKVTAAPKYNIQVSGDSTYKDDFDFSVEDAYKDIAANTHITDLLPGRMMKLGVTLQLYNDNASKGLKGIELPKGDITFDLDVSSRYTINQPAEGHTQGDVVDTTTAYRPLLWSCDGNRWMEYGGQNQDGRAIWDELACSPHAPYNQGNGRTGCWNGGQWAASQERETGKIHITVSGYEINPDYMPVINGDNSSGSYGANVGCFSAGQIWIVQPFNTITDGEHGEEPYFDVVKTYGQGAFATTAVAKNLQATTVSEKKVVQGQNGFQQAVTNDDELTRTLELVLPGSVQNRVRYASVSDPTKKGAGVDDSRDGRDYAAVGSELRLMGGFSYNARREERNQLCLGTNLMKFYGSAIEPVEGDWILSLTGGASLHGESGDGAKDHIRVMYATKQDGTDWKNDNELKGTYENGLKFYNKLSEIPDGHVCVGILTSFIGPGAPVDASDPYYLCYYRAKVKDDMKLAGNTYMLASTSRVWTKETLSENHLRLEDIPDWTAESAYPKNMQWMNCSHLKSANIDGFTWYNKETYKPDGSGIYGTHNSDWGHWGDTLLVIGYKTRIGKKLMQKDGNGQDKKTFNLDADQRVADFRLQPGTYYDQPGTYENTATVTIVDTLPRYMSYKPGSAYFGGAYKQSSSYGGTKGTIIKDETLGAAFPDPVLTEPTVTNNADGTQTLTWVIDDVKIGDPMAPIYYSVDIGSKGNPDEDVPVGTTNLKNTVYIATPYDMRDPMNTEEKHAEAGIAVTRGSASSFGKYTKQKVADEDGQIDYVVYFNNNAETTASVTIMDTMPADQISGSHFTGTYTFSEWKIDTSKCDIDGIKIYYTFDKEYQDRTTKEVSREEIVEEGGSWHQTEIGTDGKIKIPASVTDQTGSKDAVQEHPVAWAVTGTLESGKSVYINLKLKLDPGVSARDKTENNYFVNRLSSGDTTTTTETPTVRRTLEGLTWMDHNRDGVQNEESGDRLSGIKVTLLKLREGGNPEEEAGYEVVCYPNTSTPISIRTGEQISIRAAGEKDAMSYEAGRYRFTDLPAGTFAVKFESADGTGGYRIADLKATGKDCGDNDYMDSDAEAFYSENGTVLDKTVIFGIRMPEAEEMSVSLYESKFHDSGFYTGVPLTIQKTDESGDLLSGASFTMSDGSGRMLSFVEENGAYRAVTEEDIVSSAYVYIAFASNERYVMGFDGTGNGASAQIQLKNDSQAQQFQMYTYDDGSVGFQHRASGRWLDLDGGNTGTDAKIQLWDGTGNPSSNQNHKWILDPCKDYYMIHSANGSNDSYIDLDCGITEEGHKIHTWSRGDSTQRWKLIPVKTVGEPNGILTVKADGSLQIKDLMPGEYSLTEIASPEGYTLLRDPVKIEVKKDGTVSVKSGEGAVSDDGDGNSAVLSVKNVKLYELPEAGGIGTYWYTISGTLLMIAGMLVLYRKNMRGRC